MLARAVSARKLTQTGAAALIAACDPFHDKPIENHRGWPDLWTSPSVMRHFKHSFTVQAADAGGSILIHTYPILDKAKLHMTTRSNAVIDTIIDSVSTNLTIAPVVIYKFTNAQSTLPVLPLTSATGETAVEFSAVEDSWFKDGPARLCGLGVEVRDVTAEIYRQGTCTLYEMPQSIAERSVVQTKAQVINGVSYVPTAIQGLPIMRPPSNLKEMMTYPSTLQWTAPEGAYLAANIQENNDPLIAEYCVPLMSTSDSVAPYLLPDEPNQLNTTSWAIGSFASGGVNGDHLVFLPHVFTPLDSKGIYLSGLNGNSVFTITVSYYVETFPLGFSELMPLAIKSACYDPLALKLISEAAMEMPIGCPVRENPLGEWFWDVVETIAPILGTVGSVIAPQFSPLIGGAAAGVTQLAARQRQAAAQREKEKREIKREVRKEIARDIVLKPAAKGGK